MKLSHGAIRPSRFLLIAALTSLLLTACTETAVRSTPLTSMAGGTGGITYFLPMRYAVVTFERVKADGKAAEAVVAAKNALKEAEGTLKAAQQSVAAHETLLKALAADGIPNTSEVYRGAQAELIKARIDVTNRTTALATANGKLSQANSALSRFNNDHRMCGYVDSIRVELQPPVPDTSKRYELSLETRAARHDHFTIATTSSGLLKTVDSELQDQTGEILVSLAKSIVATPKGVLFNIENARPRDAIGQCETYDWKPKLFSQIIDPSSDDGWKAVSKLITEVATVELLDKERDKDKAPLVTFAYELKLETPGIPSDSLSCAQSGLTETKGIYYRRERPLLVKSTLDALPIGGFVLVVPNGAPADIVHVEATVFVKNVQKLGFDNGMLVSVDSTKPSPMLAVVSVPWTIARETVQIVSDLIQLRVNIGTGDTAIKEQQVKLTEQMQALLEAQEELKKAREAKPDDASEPEEPAG